MASVSVKILYSEKDLAPYQIHVKFLCGSPVSIEMFTDYMTGYINQIAMKNVWIEVMTILIRIILKTVSLISARYQRKFLFRIDLHVSRYTGTQQDF